MNELVQYNSGLVPRAQLARMPEVVKALDKGERLILGASLSKPVKDYPFDELAGELKKVITWVARDIGYIIKGDDDMQYIIVRTAQLLKRYYETLSVEDFRLAFEMAVAGELEGYLPKDWKGNTDAHHYQQFSAEYVCKILNGYKTKRLQALKKAEQAGPKVEGPGVSESDQQRNAKRMRAELVWCWLHFKYRGRLPKISPIQEMRFYDILAEVGLAEPIEVTEAEQAAVLSKTIMHYATAGLVADLQRVKNEGKDSEEIQGEAFRRARRNALIRVLDYITKNEIQLCSILIR